MVCVLEVSAEGSNSSVIDHEVMEVMYCVLSEFFVMAWHLWNGSM